MCGVCVDGVIGADVNGVVADFLAEFGVDVSVVGLLQLLTSAALTPS